MLNKITFSPYILISQTGFCEFVNGNIGQKFGKKKVFSEVLCAFHDDSLY